MHTCDGCIYYDPANNECRREYDGLASRTGRRPGGIMRLVAWVRGLFHKEEEELYDDETP